jgi:hypothetical protein
VRFLQICLQLNNKAIALKIQALKRVLMGYYGGVINNIETYNKPNSRARKRNQQRFCIFLIRAFAVCKTCFDG